jgi:alpha-beta hydrolase superfamily lysophospholipase
MPDLFRETLTMLISQGTMLSRRSIIPSDPWATVAFLHGYGDHSGRHLHFLQWLAERGVAGHAIDFRGHGRSPGRRGYIRRWEEYLEDLQALMADLPSGPPVFIVGHSHGGLIAAAAAVREQIRVTGYVLTSPFFRSALSVPLYKVLVARMIDPIVPWMQFGSDLSQDLMTGDEAMRADGNADALMLRAATPRWYFTTGRIQREVLRDAGQFSSPLLILFGGSDPIADLGAARQFFDAAASRDKTMKVYPGLLHEVLRETIRESIFEDILQWIRARTPIVEQRVAPSLGA